MIKNIAIFITTLTILSGCCSPQQFYFTDPTYFDRTIIEKDCPINCCPPGVDCSGFPSPWIHLEIELQEQLNYKAGLSYYGYAGPLMAAVTGDVVFNIPFKSTAFELTLNSTLIDYPGANLVHPSFGTTYRYANFKNQIGSSIKPFIGVSFPNRYFKQFQVSYGYQIGISPTAYSGHTFSVDYKFPLPSFR